MHSFNQLANQTTDSWQPLVVLTLPDSSTISLGVTVQDTQAGALYENEIWTGNHLVSGIVVVPPGLTLAHQFE